MPRIGIDLTACWRPRVGMVSAALGLSRALVALGPASDVTLFCSRLRPPGFPAATRAVLSPHRHEIANKLAWLPFVEGQAGLDVIIYPYWPTPPRRSAQAPPAAVFVHDLAFRVRPGEVPWQQRLYLGTLLPSALKLAAAVLVPSDATRRDLLHHYPLANLDERITIVGEGPSGLGEEAGPLPAGLAPGFLLAVGTIEPRKNYPRLLDAYASLRASRGESTPPLVVVGRTGWAYGDALERLRRAPGVVLLGHIDDAALLGLYRAAAALVFVSLYEGFGLPLLDAMVEGLPTLIGTRGSLPELAAGAALEVDPERPDQIAAGIARLLDDQPLRAELIQTGRRRAAQFSWQVTAERVRDVLWSVADQTMAR